jgi:hypothetical protein
VKKTNLNTRFLALLTALAIILSFSGSAFAIDDGARAYWKGRAGTYGVSFQYLRLDADSMDADQFDPGLYIYPNSDTEANLFIANCAYHFALLNRASSLALNLAGGNVDVDINGNAVPPQFLPPGVDPGSSVSQSATGLADPSIQLVVNLLGTPALRSNVDLLNYEPGCTVDIAALLAFPVGEYDKDKLVNMGQNRWFGRVALPFKYHFGVFTPGYMSSLELIPSAWLFAENDDLLGQKLENDPLWQVEAHLTHDFTRNFFASLDMLYRGGFQSEINGADVGDKLNIGDIGFTLSFQATDNLAIRTGYSTNVFGDDDLDTSLLRIQFVYGWNTPSENMKKLTGGGH